MLKFLYQLFKTNIFLSKVLIIQNNFQLNNSYAFPKAILHECQRSCKLVYLYSSFVYSMSDDAVYCIESAMFLSSVLLSTRGKRITITFHKNQKLNIGNQYHKDATELAPGIKFEESHDIIPHQIDETLKRQQIKYQKIVQALDRVLYLIGKKRFLFKGRRKQLQTVISCKIQELS